MLTHNEIVLIIDTETINLEKRYIYDFGYIIAMYNEKSNEFITLEENQFLTKQIWENKMLFSTAYYSNKENLYKKIMAKNAAKGIKTKKHFGHIMRKLQNDIDKYDIKKWFAYNSNFDKGALEFTCEWFKLDNPLLELKMYDIQNIAGIIHHSEDYKKFANDNNFINQSGYLQTNAENTYRYITQDIKFIESHTSLQDCIIELEILNHCLKLDKKIDTNYKRFVPSNQLQTKTIVMNKDNKKKYIDIHYKKMINRKKKNQIEFIL